MAPGLPRSLQTSGREEEKMTSPSIARLSQSGGPTKRGVFVSYDSSSAHAAAWGLRLHPLS